MQILDARAARVTLTVALVAVILYAAFLARKTIFVFILALFVSYMIAPLVRLLDRYRPRRAPPITSVVAAFALLFGVAVAVLAVVGPIVSTQAANLIEQIPKWAQRASDPSELPLPGFLESLRPPIEDMVREARKGATGSALPLLRGAGLQAMHLAGILPLLVLIPILAFVFVSDSVAIRARLLALVRSTTTRARATEVVNDVDTLLGSYVQALAILSLATFLSYSAFFLIAAVPFGLLLAAIAAVLEFIPFLGPLAAGVIAVALAAIAGYDHLLWIVLFIIAYRGFQDYILSPRLLSGGAHLHPALVIFAFLAGEEIGGVAGMFVSVPVLAIALVVARAVLAHPPAAARKPPPV